MSFKEDFGKRLKYWREKRGMTKDELRDLSGIRAKASIISLFEVGELLPAYKDVEALAKPLGIAPQVLMGGTRRVITLDCDALDEILIENEVESISSCEGDKDMKMIIYWDYDGGNEDEQA